MVTNEKTKTEPINPYEMQSAPKIVVTATYQDPTTKALYIHQDLVRVQEPWAEEAHIRPMAVTERFGDVASFVAYVKRYGGNMALLTWNSQGIKATLDYAESETVTGRHTWQALYPFVNSQQWQAWKALANGNAVAQKAAVEKLEDLAADIIEPSPADLMNLLRNLRASVNAKADAELRPDGTTSIAFTQDKTVKAGSNVELPASFTIAIPALKGHVDDKGRAVTYKLQVRLRVSVGDDAHLALRFSMPEAERVLEDVYGDRVSSAKMQLGVAFQLLRAAD